MTRNPGTLPLVLAAALLPCLAGCPSAQIVTDPCAGVTCADGEACESGSCVAAAAVDPCPDVPCADGEVCEHGQCVPNEPADACADVTCPDGEVCDAGECVAEQTGDPCAGVTCPDGEACLQGLCVVSQATGADPDAGHTYYMARCEGCHKDDATGILGPDIVGQSGDRVFAILSGAADHGFGPTIEDVTQQEADDVAAWLATLP